MKRIKQRFIKTLWQYCANCKINCTFHEFIDLYCTYQEESRALLSSIRARAENWGLFGPISIFLTWQIWTYEYKIKLVWLVFGIRKSEFGVVGGREGLMKGLMIFRQILLANERDPGWQPRRTIWSSRIFSQNKRLENNIRSLKLMRPTFVTLTVPLARGVEGSGAAAANLTAG